MIAARSMPCTPTMFQSQTKIRPICPAMAPSTMPKFRPMPAMMGISRESTRNELRDRRTKSS